MCRNVLIYPGTILQKKVMKVFHYALKPSGWLLLGSSESIGGSADLFTLRDKKHKLYARKSTTIAPSFAFAPGEYSPAQPRLAKRSPQPVVAERPFSDLTREADQVVMSRFAPPGVVLDENMNIVQFRGETESYLKPNPGEASLNILKMTREDLLAFVHVPTADRIVQARGRQELPIARQGQGVAIAAVALDVLGKFLE